MQLRSSAACSFLKAPRPADTFRQFYNSRGARSLHQQSYLTLKPHSLTHRVKRSTVSRPSSSPEHTETITLPESLSGPLIREKFLKFFEDRGHQRLPSASLIPDDPTVLLTIAGMLPFKPIFLGQEVPEHPRVTTSQKCVRTNDIENVGRTARHQTFFEMLGNFSFGDYFKRDAIQWAWELSTKEFGLSPSSIWVSVFEEDDKAFEIWSEIVPVERIIRMGIQDNFWAAGPTGPCGPCSELYYDFHPELGTTGVDLNDDRRFIEFYNLVFMETNRSADGSVEELGQKSIDTGMGLERMAQILQQTTNNYETDLIFPIVEKAAKLAGLDYGMSSVEQQRDLKVMGDHTRAATYLISDGVVPTNVGRGYIVRRLIRRIVMKGWLLGIKEPFTESLSLTAIDLSTGCDPNVKKQKNRICAILNQEEEQFRKTLATGEKKLKEFLSEGKERTGMIAGSQAFMLFDTFGFPLEITEEIAATEGIEVDIDGFETEMSKQKEQSKSAREEIDITSSSQPLLSSLPQTEFLGYTRLASTAKILALIRQGEVVEEVSSMNGDGSIEFEVILDRSPFYAESGGQIGDKGVIKTSQTDSAARIHVHDVQSSLRSGIHVHKARLSNGRVIVNDDVSTEVDASFRYRLMCHHTATHLLQSAIKKVLGTEVCQQGSLVSYDRLRFDFNSGRSVTDDQIDEIELVVNTWIQEHLPLASEVMSLKAAKETGAIAMFGEKYGEDVRVVTVPGVSKELCGGTHVGNTSELLAFKVLSESAIQSGIRRIEAVAGPAAIRRFSELSKMHGILKDLLKGDIDEIPFKVQDLRQQVREQGREIETLKQQVATMKAEKLLQTVDVLANGCRSIVAQLDGVDGKGLQSAASFAMGSLTDPCAVVLGGVCEDRVVFAAAFSASLVKRKLHAGRFISEAAKKCGGGGGGRPDVAQAGAKDVRQLSATMDFVETELRGLLEPLDFSKSSQAK